MFHVPNNIMHFSSKAFMLIECVATYKLDHIFVFQIWNMENYIILEPFTLSIKLELRMCSDQSPKCSHLLNTKISEKSLSYFKITNYICIYIL